MELSKLIEGLPVIDIKGAIKKDITRVVYDSRRAVPGSLFVCIDGFKTDGHRFSQSAADNGASSFLVEKDITVFADATVIKVPDTRYALAHVSAAFFGHPSDRLDLIGVTGTKGKTTTTHMIKSILEQTGQTVGLIGTVENRKAVRFFSANATVCELDKQGRILIPNKLREYASLDKELLFIGGFNKVEIWNPNNYEDSDAEEIGSILEAKNIKY
jgi:UDP-N-acetylmuramyl pentapeptide synthase